MTWKPINTAPRDYDFLAYWPDQGGDGSWNLERTWYSQADNTYETPTTGEPCDSPNAPTHWWDDGGDMFQGIPRE